MAKVSFIVPVYNVYQWLDQCMESIVSQTFTDFEILLINDGSTDGSDVKCLEWASKEPRIRYISKKNEGTSATRNLGIQEALGDYLAFIDADDWVAQDYLGKMYNCAMQTGADIVECDVWRYNDKTGEMTIRRSYGSMGIDYTMREHMKLGNTAIWKCLIRRKLMTENNVLFPICHSESRAIYPLLLALSIKIENVREPLYYYRRFRPQSLSEKPRQENGEEVIGIQAFESLIEGFKKNNIHDQYESLLQEIVNYKLSDILAANFYRTNKSDFDKMVNCYYQFIYEKFPDCKNDKYINLGSYNLNRILWNLNLLHNPYCRFNFSSLISLMRPVAEAIKVVHENKYREIMINRDIKSDFWDVLDEIRPDFIVLDLLEERFDIVECEKGYITKSDALDSAKNRLKNNRLIKRNSEECNKLWQYSCELFINKLCNYVSPNKIILIKNYLSEKVGDAQSQKAFDRVGEIKIMNKILENYYHFFSAHCQNALVIDVLQSPYYFTDQDYEYGAIPAHLNDLVNREISIQIKRVLEE